MPTPSPNSVYFGPPNSETIGLQNCSQKEPGNVLKLTAVAAAFASSRLFQRLRSRVNLKPCLRQFAQASPNFTGAKKLRNLVDFEASGFQNETTYQKTDLIWKLR